MKTADSAFSLLHRLRVEKLKRGGSCRRFESLKRHHRRQALNRRQLLPRLCDSVLQQLCSGHVASPVADPYHRSQAAGPTVINGVAQEFIGSWEEEAPLSPVRHFGFPVAACRAALASNSSHQQNLSFASLRVVNDDVDIFEIASAVQEMPDPLVTVSPTYSDSAAGLCCHQAQLLPAVKSAASSYSATDASSQLTAGRRSQVRRAGKKSSRVQQRQRHRRRLSHLLPADATSETWDLPSSTDASLDWQLLKIDRQPNADQISSLSPPNVAEDQALQSEPLSASSGQINSLHGDQSIDTLSGGAVSELCNTSAASMDSAFFTCSGVSPRAAASRRANRESEADTGPVLQQCLTLLGKIRSILTSSDIINLNLKDAIRTRDLLSQIDANFNQQASVENSEALSILSSPEFVVECDASNPSMDTLTCVDLAVAREAGDNIGEGGIRLAEDDDGQKHHQERKRRRQRGQRTHLLRLMGLTRRRRREVDSFD